MEKTKVPDILGKKDLIKRLAEECGIFEQDARMIIDALIKILKETVTFRKIFKVGGLGSIIYSKVPARTTSNFGKGEIEFPESTKVLFSLSETITKRIK